MTFVAIAAVWLVVGSGLLALGRDQWTTSSSIRSEVLSRDMPVAIFSPPQVAECPPDQRHILFVFHGRGADEAQWFHGRFGSGAGLDAAAHRLIEAGAIPPITIVSAFIDQSYGVDSAPANDGYTHGPYERFILDELIPTMEQRVGAGGTAERRSVAGISMGGFVALSLGLRTDLFHRAGGLSAAIYTRPPRSREWIYGPGGSRSPVALVETAPLTNKSFFLGRGTRDFDWIRSGTDELTERLRARGAPVESLVVTGGHDSTTTRQLVEPLLTTFFGEEANASGC